VTGNQFLKEAESLREMRVLEEIEANPGLSQREAAERLGVAVGIVNSLIHALVRKGLVKVRGENNRTITYHLTKAGVLQKSRLAFEWTMNTIDFYRDARGKVAARLAAMAATGLTDVVILGTNELAEIAAIVSAEAGVNVIGAAYAEGTEGAPKLAGFPAAPLAELLATHPHALVACIEPSDSQRALAQEAGVPVFDLTGETPWPFSTPKAVGS
jgi:DNA-binding MarR family transcriptional regulator